MWEEPRSKTVRNCSFWPKTMVFNVVFKCGRSQGLKLSKTTVFGQKPWFSAPKTAVFKSGRSLGLKLPKTAVFGQKLWFSVWFSVVGRVKD